MRVAAVAAAICLCVGGLSFADPSQALVKKPTNIPAQKLTTALEELAKERDLQLVYRSEVVGEARTGGAAGDLTLDEAFTQLLAGTGLTYRYLGDNAVTILPLTQSSGAAQQGSASVKESGTASEATEEGKRDSSGDFRVAQATAGQSQADVSVDKGSEEEPKKKPMQLEEVIVTGTRIPTAVGQQAVAVRTYTHEDIERSGQTTVSNFLNTLPDVSISQGDSLSIDPTVSTNSTQLLGQSTVQLHGLPYGVTLTLLDGRPLGTNLWGSFDLNAIPTAAIERVEILPVGASAIYGSNALGGAVNMILRKDFKGFEAKATYGTAAGGLDEAATSLAWGDSWERGSVSLVGSYRESHSLRGGTRKWTTTTDFPANSFAQFEVGDACAPGNVYSLNGGNLPGLSSSQAAIPSGITGKPSIQDFAATAGTTNQCFSQRYSPSIQTQELSLMASAHYHLSESADLFTDVIFTRQNLSLPNVATAFSATLPASNPFNPFGQDVAVSFAAPLNYSEPIVSDMIKPLIGIRGAVGSNWHYEASAYVLHTTYRDHGGRSFDYGAVPGAGSSFNPFTTPAANPPASIGNPFVQRGRVADAQVLLRGPLMRLPAGPVETVVGGEYGQEKQYYNNLGSPLDYFRASAAVFTEAHVPLLASSRAGSDGASSNAERLALTAAARYDHAGDYGGKATWQAGLLWHATETLSARASFGTSYRAPLPNELRQPPLIYTGDDGIDPFRGNEPVRSVKNLLGPNPNLNPETGESRTLTLDYGSRSVSGLRGSLTWFTINIANYIGLQSPQDLIDFPNLFPGAVVRAPAPAPTDPPGYPGQIIQVNNVNYNFGKFHLAGFDGDVSYTWESPIGRWTPSLAVSNMYRFRTAILPSAPSTDGVSNPTGSQTANFWSPRWKGTATLAWSKGPISMSLAGRYVSRYNDYQWFFLPPNTNKLGNFWRFDFSSSADLGRVLFSGNRWLSGMHASLGATNLFNQMPPFSYGIMPYDFSQYDIRGRYIHAELGLRW